MKLLIALFSFAFALNVSANSQKSINGTWMVDLEATERTVTAMTPRNDAAEVARGFVAMGAYMIFVTLTIDDDLAKLEVLTPGESKDNTEDEFKRELQNGNDRSYISTATPSKGTLTITAVKEVLNKCPRTDFERVSVTGFRL
ncbi:hypothetical protein [Pseudothauera rhizosphaerae]|uniref:Lipocalin-like domain-containing protein n=1 Tax=Pseudothauera rhizosphaerae TaxID=2565932 RepID=A0A4S4AD58_9RHOO|nr:hypothetical protein [Pseudothauera rhizosphaerae]THF56916.1 hypothetical protein E6O51_18990 [Pseudothauera rhizosphaerae]